VMQEKDSKNGEVFHRVQEERNILHKIGRGKANRIGHTLRRNCLLKHVIPGKKKIKVMGGRGRRRKLILDAVKQEDNGN